jgi:Cu(I)/Ag(I) efflux system periplasmic protein CusF
MKRRLVLALALSWPLVAYAADTHKALAPGAPAAADLTDGEVRRIDRDARKITIRHGPIRNLDMPPMTMVFQVADAAMLDAVKPGDRVSFAADKVGNAYTITRLVPVPAQR